MSYTLSIGVRDINGKEVVYMVGFMSGLMVGTYLATVIYIVKELI